jgi:uncharacterized Tic20 family protein
MSPDVPHEQPTGSPPGGPVPYAPEHPRATTALALGILGLALCQVLGPVAWWVGKRTVDEIDASGGRYGGRGAAQVGYVLGIVATVLLGIAVVLTALYAAFFLALVAGTMASF